MYQGRKLLVICTKHQNQKKWYHPKPLRLCAYQHCQHNVVDRLAQTQMTKGRWSLAAWQCTMEQKQKGELLLLLLSASLVTCDCRIKQQDWSRSMPLSFRNTCSSSHRVANCVPELEACRAVGHDKHEKVVPDSP